MKTMPALLLSILALILRILIFLPGLMKTLLLGISDRVESAYKHLDKAKSPLLLRMPVLLVLLLIAMLLWGVFPVVYFIVWILQKILDLVTDGLNRLHERNQDEQKPKGSRR